MKGMRSKDTVELCNVCCLATCRDGSKYIIIVNQCLVDYNKDQYESLLQPHQARANDVVIDDIPLHHLVDYEGTYGTQSIHLRDGTSVPLDFDGFKTFLNISKPSLEDMASYPRVVLTSDEPYAPQERVYSRRMEPKKLKLADWQARLGYCTEEVARKTLEGTTRMVSSVEAETRDYPRDHKKCRLPMLRPIRINDTACLDIFHSSIRSVRGYKKFMMCNLIYSKLDDVHLLREEHQAVGCWQDFIRRIGAPNMVLTDCAQIFQGKEFLQILRHNVIDNHFSEPHHQNENPAERSGGAFKTDLLLLYSKTPWAPLSYWCFATEFLNVVRKMRCRKALGWRPPLQILHGETKDISMLRFFWFQPVFFYDKNSSFPTNKLVPGFFLGFDITVGDGFCYKILVAKDIKDIPLRRPKVLTRSVVRARDLDMKEEDFPVAVETVEGLVIRDSKGNVLEGELDKDIEQLPGSEESDSEESASEEQGSEEPVTDPIEIELLEDSTANSIPDDQLLDLSFDTSEVVNDSRLPIVEEVEEDEDSPLHEEAANPLAQATALFEPASTSSPAMKYNMISQHDDESIESDNDFDSEDDLDYPLTRKEKRKIVQQVNKVFEDEKAYDIETEDEEFEIEYISEHRFMEGELELKCHYYGGEYDWIPWRIACAEAAKLVSDYIGNADFENKIITGITNRWKRKFDRKLRTTIRRVFKVDFELHYGLGDEAEPTLHTTGSRMVRQAKKVANQRQKKRKPGRNKRHMNERVFKYGHEVPKRYADCIRIDEANNNTAWQDSIAKEVAALVYHGCFDFKSPNFKPSRDFQKAYLHWVYDIKSCGRFKSRLVCQGHRVDPRGLSTRATVVKTLSARALDVIAAANGLKTVIGDIGNAFIQAKTKEKCFIECGPEFGDKQGCIALIVKALYGLRTSAERFHSLLADFLRGLGFTPSKFDRDVWLRRRIGNKKSDLDVQNDGYDYICTHVDDFKIVAEKPEHWLKKIQDHFLVKEHGPLKYYLGNDFSYCAKGKLWTFGSKTYANESIKKVESLFGVLPKSKTPLPVSKDCHPEIDDTPLLNEDKHRRYQMLLGMLQWLNTIGRPDLCHACSSLSRFGACPRETHLELALHCFQYLKQFPDRKIAIDPRPLNYDRVSPNWEKLRPDFLYDYPDAKEEDDPKFPPPLGKALTSTILVDADHGHDKKTGRSLTGLILYLGSTPVLWLSKRQGAIACSTYHAEFSALRTAAEKSITIRYLLRAFGVPIDGATDVFGDNFSVIQNSQNPESELEKKHVALSFHYVRENIAAGVISPYWLKGKLNMSDIMTKQIASNEFNAHCDSLFYRPDFHIRDRNNLSEELSTPVRRLRNSCLVKKVTFARDTIFKYGSKRRR